jgi:hypothetical protein
LCLRKTISTKLAESLRRGTSLLPWIANWYFTILWARDPPLSECPTHSFVRAPFMFFLTLWTVYQRWVYLKCLLLDEVIALVGATLLTDVSPDLLAKSIAVDSFNGGLIPR